MTQVLTDEMLATASSEQRRRGNARARVLEGLIAAGAAGLLNWQLVKFGGMEAPRRVRELRAEGYEIHVEPVGEGAWRYTYVPPTVEHLRAARGAPGAGRGHHRRAALLTAPALAGLVLVLLATAVVLALFIGGAALRRSQVLEQAADARRRARLLRGELL